jgi:hypothetical protein
VLTNKGKTVSIKDVPEGTLLLLTRSVADSNTVIRIEVLTVDRDQGAALLPGVEPLSPEQLASVVPSFFWLPYPEKQLWLRVDAQHFIERSTDGSESKYTILGRTQARGQAGTLVAKVAGDPGKTGNGNDGKYQVFIPDRRSSSMLVLFRHMGKDDSAWYGLAEMSGVE